MSLISAQPYERSEGLWEPHPRVGGLVFQKRMWLMLQPCGISGTWPCTNALTIKTRPPEVARQATIAKSLLNSIAYVCLCFVLASPELQRLFSARRRVDTALRGLLRGLGLPSQTSKSFGLEGFRVRIPQTEATSKKSTASSRKLP